MNASLVFVEETAKVKPTCSTQFTTAVLQKATLPEAMLRTY
jgi:hypothetical protein